VEDEKVVQPLKPVIRMATKADDEVEKRNHEKEKEAFKICKEKIRKHGLQMKLIDAEYTFDNNKVLFYFTADGRIDFRELVKDLASVFKTRIELRQVGVRDETKIVGGIGICGRTLCCHSYLSEFIPVSIKMAKEQNLSILSYLANHFSNPTIEFAAPLIAFVAISKSFLGHYIGASEGLKGLIVKSGKRPGAKALDRIVAAFMVVICWIVATLDPSILGMIETVGGPVIAAILFLMPMYAIRKVPAMARYRGQASNVFVTAVGLVAISALVYKLAV